MLEPGLETLFDLHLGPVIASFLFLSALAHLTVSLPGTYSWYARNLERRINYARWIEYSLSSSVMMVAIAVLAGVYGVVSLLAIFALNGAMILFGWKWNTTTRIGRRRIGPPCLAGLRGDAPAKLSRAGLNPARKEE